MFRFNQHQQLIYHKTSKVTVWSTKHLMSPTLRNQNIKQHAMMSVISKKKKIRLLVVHWEIFWLFWHWLFMQSLKGLLLALKKKHMMFGSCLQVNIKHLIEFQNAYKLINKFSFSNFSYCYSQVCDCILCWIGTLHCENP